MVAYSNIKKGSKLDSSSTFKDFVVDGAFEAKYVTVPDELCYDMEQDKFIGNADIHVGDLLIVAFSLELYHFKKDGAYRSGLRPQVELLQRVKKDFAAESMPSSVQKKKKVFKITT